MFPALDNDLHFGYQLTGSLVVARSEEDEKFLEELIKRGDANGVKNLRILREKELKEVEPHIHPDSKVHDILLLSLLALLVQKYKY
jgi:glycerol-3-phosphate dehydrogenase